MLVPRGGDASTDAPKTRKPTLMNAAAAQLVAVVDGSNVAWAAIQKHKAALANSASPPPLRGLVICVNFLLEHGHKPVAICPEWWFRPTTQLAEDDAATLKALLEHEIAVSAPPDSHDDYSVLSCAIMFQSSNPVVIITNDLMCVSSTPRHCGACCIAHATELTPCAPLPGATIKIPFCKCTRNGCANVAWGLASAGTCSSRTLGAKTQA
jgi:hypothetical protein